MAGRRSIYPFPEWEDGKDHHLLPGVDFVKRSSLLDAIRQRERSTSRAFIVTKHADGSVTIRWVLFPHEQLEQRRDDAAS